MLLISTLILSRLPKELLEDWTNFHNGTEIMAVQVSRWNGPNFFLCVLFCADAKLLTHTHAKTSTYACLWGVGNWNWLEYWNYIAHIWMTRGLELFEHMILFMEMTLHVVTVTRAIPRLWLLIWKWKRQRIMCILLWNFFVFECDVSISCLLLYGWFNND